MKKLVIHIGYPKTATTSLQQNVFRRLHERKQINCIYNEGRAFPNALRRARQAKGGSARPIKVNYIRGSTYNARPDPAYFHGLLSDSKVNLISDESLSTACLAIRNDPWTLKPRFVIDNSACSPPLSVTPSIVHQLFHDDQTEIKILVTLRNQSDLLESFFVQLMIVGLPHPAADSPSKMYFERGAKGRQELRDTDFLKQFNFAANISEWSTLFGRSNVTIIFYEDLVSNPAYFERRLSDILEIEEEGLISSLFNLGKELNTKARVDGQYATRDRILKRVFGKRLGYAIEPFHNVSRRLRNRLGLSGLSLTKLLVSSPFLKRATARNTARNTGRFTQRHASFTEEERAIIADYFRESNLSLASSFNLDLEKLRKYSYL